MKTKHFMSIVIIITSQLSVFAIKQQSDSLGMLGDNLDLYGVLELFKNADNTQEFEKALNSDKNKVNNLDLNNDGKVDYIRTIDYQKDNSRAIILQVDINEKEAQDVAVIEINKIGEEVANIQIIGDEDLYGKDYIVEPLNEKAAPATAKSTSTTVVVNVWNWRPMRYYYGPKYVVWVSPWRWSHYPVWYTPWTPFAWRIHHQHMLMYRPYWQRVYVHRAPHIRPIYYPYRKTSTVVYVHRSTNKSIDNNGQKRNNTTIKSNEQGRNRSKFEHRQNVRQNNNMYKQPSGERQRSGGGKRQENGKGRK